MDCLDSWHCDHLLAASGTADPIVQSDAVFFRAAGKRAGKQTEGGPVEPLIANPLAVRSFADFWGTAGITISVTQRIVCSLRL